METKPSDRQIIGIRTLARDLAASGKDQSTTNTTKPSTVKKAVAEQNGTPENFVYKAPNGVNQKPRSEDAKKQPADQIPKKIEEVMEDETETPTLKPLATPKRTKEPTIIVDNEDAAAATIIRDTKRNRFRLFPAIGESLSEWFSGIKERYFTKKAPKYTVPETTHRKGVIQKATSKTGRIATFDTASMQERIKARRERVLPKKPLTIWTANTEPGFALLEAPEDATPPPRITNVQVVPRRSSQPQPSPASAPSAIPPKPSVPPKQKIPTIIIASETEPIVPAAPAPTPTPPPDSAITEAVPAPTTLPPVAPAPTPETIEPPITKLKPQNLREWLFSLNTNIISLGISLVVLALTLAGFAGYQWLGSRSVDITIDTSPNHPALLAEKVQLLYSPSLETEALLTLIKDNRANSPYQIFELALTTDQAGHTLLPAESVFAALRWSVDPIFSRTVSTIRFGAIDQQTPFVALRVTDPISARGSLLVWEPSMLQAMATLFSTPITPGETTTFNDLTIADVDTRILTDDTGVELLIYTITGNLVIITNSRSALERLLEVTN